MTAILDRPQRIAVIDDDAYQAEVIGELVREAGLEPHPVEGTFTHMAALVDAVRATGEAAVCDHRLRHHRYSPVDGAELVARLTEVEFPAILVTQYLDSDADTAIRRWRHLIPVLLSRDETDPSAIAEGLRRCRQEILGDVPMERQGRRTLLQIELATSDERAVEARVVAWNPREVIRLPRDMIPFALTDAGTGYAYVFSTVNLSAERATDLFFTDFEAAPEPVSADDIA